MLENVEFVVLLTRQLHLFLSFQFPPLLNLLINQMLFSKQKLNLIIYHFAKTAFFQDCLSYTDPLQITVKASLKQAPYLRFFF